MPETDPVVTLEVAEDEEIWLRKVGIIVTWAGEIPGTLRVDTAVGSAEIYNR